MSAAESRSAPHRIPTVISIPRESGVCRAELHLRSEGAWPHPADWEQPRSPMRSVRATDHRLFPNRTFSSFLALISECGSLARGVPAGTRGGRTQPPSASFSHTEALPLLNTATRVVPSFLMERGPSMG